MAHSLPQDACSEPKWYPITLGFSFLPDNSSFGMTSTRVTLDASLCNYMQSVEQFSPAHLCHSIYAPLYWVAVLHKDLSQWSYHRRMHHVHVQVLKRNGLHRQDVTEFLQHALKGVGMLTAAGANKPTTSEPNSPLISRLVR